MRRLLILMAASLVAACSNDKAAPQPETKEAPAPSGVYLKIYADRFVAAMRAAKLEAGAFEISKRAEADGRFHLGVDVGDKRLLVALRPMGEGLTPVTATLAGEPVFPGGTGAWTQPAGWHALADHAARSER